MLLTHPFGPGLLDDVHFQPTPSCDDPLLSLESFAYTAPLPGARALPPTLVTRNGYGSDYGSPSSWTPFNDRSSTETLANSQAIDLVGSDIQESSPFPRCRVVSTTPPNHNLPATKKAGRQVKRLSSKRLPSRARGGKIWAASTRTKVTKREGPLECGPRREAAALRRKACARCRLLKHKVGRIQCRRRVR